MKKIIIFLMFLLLVVASNYALASRTEFDTQGSCNIKGVIKSVEFKEAFEDPCLKSDDDCLIGAYSLKTPERYYLTIMINSVLCTTDAKKGDMSYESQFQVGTEKIIYIDESNIKAGDSFAVEQGIEGQIEYNTGHYFSSYFLKNIEVIHNNYPIEPSLDWMTDCEISDRNFCELQFFLKNNSVITLLVLFLIITSIGYVLYYKK